MMLKLWVLCAALAVTGCVAVPYPVASRACDLLQIAHDESQLAPGWYISAGDALDACGYETAKAHGVWKMCGASKRNGFDLPAECKEVLD